MERNLFSKLRHGICSGVVSLLISAGGSASVAEEVDWCQVVIAGGSTAALAAALTTAREGVRTCLLEPTDWPGGQLTASGVPAIDFAWHKVGDIDVKAIAEAEANQTPEFIGWLRDLGNPGNCWVSSHCFLPKDLISRHIFPAIRRESNLRLYENTVVKSVKTTSIGHFIQSLEAVQRFPNEGKTGYENPLSHDLTDWYSPKNSQKFRKKRVRFSSKQLVVIDGSEFGDVLVLSDAPYLQGVDTAEASPRNLDDRCGQAFTYPFAQRFHAKEVVEPKHADVIPYPSFYSLGRFSWDQVWTYRRLVDTDRTDKTGQITLQNWNPGNDYPYRSWYLSVAESEKQKVDWQGGVDLKALAEAERHAYGYHEWFKSEEPRGLGKRISLDKSVFGTSHGLSKMPYLRDGRRSIGLREQVEAHFILSIYHLFQFDGKRRLGVSFSDRIAIGAYDADIHPMECALPKHLQAKRPMLPFYLPLRALTNIKINNLLVAGKNMAQSFHANSATRLHPIEWNTGIGAGVTAAWMAKNQATTRAALHAIDVIQARIRTYAPLDWSLPKP